MNPILLIEDNQDYRENLEELLQLLGYLTISAANGLLGLQKIREYSPRLIICDVDMPIMNGLEVLRVVKADAVFSMIPFLILTANTTSKMHEDLLNLGVEALLTKPIEVEELLRVIAYFFETNPLPLAERANS